MARPILYVFAISHYCEKALWALDYLGIDYTIKHLAPGVHRRVARKLGLPVSSLPIVKADDLVVQGSSDIISWAEANKSSGAPLLDPQTGRQDCLEMEQRLDDLLGVHVRRYFYSEALVEYPSTVLPVFTRDLPSMQKWLTAASWGMIRKLMIEGMDLGQEQGLESRQVVEQELNWLDQMLADGRRYLIGDRLTRVDITAASFLAPLIQPQQHHTYTNLKLPPNVQADCNAWQNRNCLRWTQQLYQENRQIVAS